ncbi:MAG: hypothetical protein JST92_15265 [Deltaproteobacteria bacterium]|nr:hypothetical protein [Deltaproteobacteria bacterium]
MRTRTHLARPTLFALCAVLSLAPAVRAEPLTPASRQKLLQLRQAIRGWAPLCNGFLAQSLGCEQGDMLEYAGLSCLSGEHARCNDARLSQTADGRFFRNPIYARNGDAIDSFSRDMLMGVFDYVLATGDKDSLERFYKWIRSDHDKLCPKASDNRCNMVPGGWGLYGMVMKHVGLKVPLLLAAAEATVDIDLASGALTVPPGYRMELVAHHIITRRKMGMNTVVMRDAAKKIAKKQPLNPLFVVLDEGPTEHVAQLTMEICKPTRGAQVNDTFFQRELRRNDKGEIVVIRDWQEPVPPRASDVANGHDCLMVIDQILADNGNGVPAAANGGLTRPQAIPGGR